MSVAVTRGIRVEVETRYLSEQSAPMEGRYAFAYSITITNEGDTPAKLVSRHWVITDAEDHVDEVRGEGVVGAQPTLQPNEAFNYTSGAVLRTPWGTMNGTYQMVLDDGSEFEAEIAPFLLAAPFAHVGGQN